MRRLLGSIFCAAAVSIGIAAVTASSVFGLAVPPVPTDIPIVDQTNTLDEMQKKSLAEIIANERQHSGNQIAVLMIPSLEGEVLEDYSLEVARTWGVGTKERNSGVLLFVAKNDRKVRIEVGYGMEGALTDIRSGQIIRNRITPEFKQGRFYEGIKSGVEGIALAIHDETDPKATTETASGSSEFPWELMLMAIFIIPSWLGAILGRTKSWWLGGVIGVLAGIGLWAIFGMVIGIIAVIGLMLSGLLFDYVVSKNYRRHADIGDSPSWWAGGTFLGGGGGSGGFGGFGGGGFGGGGASGDW